MTIAIPIRVESEDRLYNIRAVLGYLNRNLRTNVALYEVFSDRPKLESMVEGLVNLSVTHIKHQQEDDVVFHRTRYLNHMIGQCKTKVVANYDSDVLLPVESYVDCVRMIMSGSADFVYPYMFGMGQKKLQYSKWYNDRNKELLYYAMVRFLETFDLSHLDQEDTFLAVDESKYGHCLFASTESYIDAFAENEYFISYAPEDIERCMRFQKLGYVVRWLDDRFVYHLEHERTHDSSKDNLYFSRNEHLFNYLSSLTREELLVFYTRNMFI